MDFHLTREQEMVRKMYREFAENEVKRFFGIEIQAEKEIVFLVVRSDEKQQIMTALMQAVGMKTRSHGIVLSMPLSAAIKNMMTANMISDISPETPVENSMAPAPISITAKKKLIIMMPTGL